MINPVFANYPVASFFQTRQEACSSLSSILEEGEQNHQEAILIIMAGEKQAKTKTRQSQDHSATTTINKQIKRQKLDRKRESSFLILNGDSSPFRQLLIFPKKKNHSPGRYVGFTEKIKRRKLSEEERKAGVGRL
jgi:hypothetical protein